MTWRALANNLRQQLTLLAIETPVVLYFIRRLKANALADDHPWVTGISPNTAREIWPDNIAYSAGHPARTRAATDALDRDAVMSVGRFLCTMVRQSIGPERPHGPQRRMPHAVNYIHAAIHYNSAFFLFEDLDAMLAHVTNTRFVSHLKRFVRESKREPMFVLRHRTIDPLAYGAAMGTIRAQLPFFANGNGPTPKPVLWGNYSPHPAINLISGSWMSDLRSLQRGHPRLLPPLATRTHFDADYAPGRTTPTTFEHMITWVQALDIRSRGFRGQLFFTNRYKIEPKRVAEYRAAGGYLRWSASSPVVSPWRARKRQ